LKARPRARDVSNYTGKTLKTVSHRGRRVETANLTDLCHYKKVGLNNVESKLN
jgi:hypothetical protein